MGDEDLDALMWSRKLMAGIAVTLIIGGTVAGVFIFEAEWPLIKRAFAGTLMGAGTALILLANRLLRLGDED